MFPRLFRFPRRHLRRRRLATMFIALFTLLAFITPFYIIYKPPHVLIRYFASRWPDVLWHVPITSKTIALTIDDAPSGYTREILDVLQENGAHATFFVIGGQVSGREGVLKEIVEGGSELGNHAMHDEPSRALSMQQLEAELVEVEGYINATYTSLNTPRPANRFFRPGSGFFSETMRGKVGAMGFKMVLGSVYPHDAQIGYARVNARHVLSMVRPGSIIICHDRRSWTAPMLRLVLPELKKRGYTVTTVSGLLDVRRHEMETRLHMYEAH
jgi:peptidoglycan/xylan/chitin deacetylase (PgdA/CDA1 family)